MLTLSIFILNRVQFLSLVYFMILLNSLMSSETSLTRAGVFLLLASCTFWSQIPIFLLAEEEPRLTCSRCFPILAESSLEDQVGRQEGAGGNLAEPVTVCLGMQTWRWPWSGPWVCSMQTTHHPPGFPWQPPSYSTSASRNPKHGKGWVASEVHCKTTFLVGGL